MAIRIRQLAFDAGIPIIERRRWPAPSTEWSRSARKSPRNFTPPSPKFSPMSTNCPANNLYRVRPPRRGELNQWPRIASNPLFIKLHENRGMVFPIAFISLLLVILIPLPTQVLDILLCFNITLSVIVLVTTIYVSSPLEFAVFPSLLLALTLFRLVLNVATVASDSHRRRPRRRSHDRHEQRRRSRSTPSPISSPTARSPSASSSSSSSS